MKPVLRIRGSHVTWLLEPNKGVQRPGICTLKPEYGINDPESGVGVSIFMKSVFFLSVRVQSFLHFCVISRAHQKQIYRLEIYFIIC